MFAIFAIKRLLLLILVQFNIQDKKDKFVVNNVKSVKLVVKKWMINKIKNVLFVPRTVFTNNQDLLNLKKYNDFIFVVVVYFMNNKFNSKIN